MANKMKFWGVEVKSGESIVVEPGITLVHLSQACLDEVKKGKGSDSISLFVKTGDQKLVIGHLYADKLPQIYFDIVFNKKFVLSHNGKSGSVHFHGYIANTGTFGTAEPKVSLEEAKKEIKSDQKDSSSDDDDDDESEDEEFDQVKSVENGSEDDEESSDDDDDDSEDEDDDSEEENEETPNKSDSLTMELFKVDGSNKRAAESSKTPVQKKAKFVTPEKTSGKKGAVHTATPYPSKQALKKPANTDQTKLQSSKSSGGGAFRCDPCNRSFNSDGALQSHTKAKHGAAK
ncbi:histone deacetylase HDT1 isoform X1 [Rosa rugosa]|uniref:histone deacetylase HDT1 isoform X1 n=1 Tax=Rosa rugosa TaxID=74645 RepID=UPI002B4158A8|nr:histone deacetylase HDT1 isoform X1 [Rosa rugosa]